MPTSLGPLCAVVVYLAVVAFVGRGLVLMGWLGGQPPDVWSAWATIAAGAVVAAYTCETSRLRKIAQAQVDATLRQTEAMQAPVVVFEAIKQQVTNYGSAVALNVHVDEVPTPRGTMSFPSRFVLGSGETLRLHGRFDGRDAEAGQLWAALVDEKGVLSRPFQPRCIMKASEE